MKSNNNFLWLWPVLLIGLLGMSYSVSAEEELVYAGQDKSLIDWEKIDSNNWLSYRHWLSDRLMKNKNPAWVKNFRDANYKELVGRVISCVNNCRIYRGEGYSYASYRSMIREGDELHTGEDGFAWIYLQEGTLLRLSSNTSVTFREINIGKKRNFIQLRLNDGNITWLSRQSSPLIEQSAPETDVFFLPLAMLKANTFYYDRNDDKGLTDRQVLDNVLVKDQTVLNHYRRLNRLIAYNNKMVNDKPTYAMIVMSNGTIFGKDLEIELYHKLGEESYFKIRDHDDFYSQERKDERKAEFYFRGYDNAKVANISDGEWYKVDKRGKDLEEFDVSEYSQLGELLIKRIPSIMIAREIWLRKYSRFAFDQEITSDKMVMEYGYRQWENEESIKNGKDDLERRIVFLKNFTRRTESSNLFALSKLSKQLKRDGEKLYSFFDTSYYHLPLTAYLNSISRGARYFENQKKEIERLGMHFWLLKNAAGR